MLGLRPNVVLLFILIVGIVLADDSLQGALNAVNRRQQDLSFDPYSWNEENSMSYDKYDKYANRKLQLERALVDYLENHDAYTDEADDDVQPSPFRERASQKERIAAGTRLRNFRLPQQQKSNDYVEFLANDYDKRAIPNYYNYNSLGLNGVGMRKRDYYQQRQRRIPYYPVTKRFPVAKRSSGSSGSSKTDPQVESELREIFSAHSDSATHKNLEENKAMITKKPTLTTVKPKTVFPISVKSTSAPMPVTTDHMHDEGTTLSERKDLNKEKPLDMKKKSIKWSDYWGLDRRKKSSNMENEWLLPRYHNAIVKKSDNRVDNNAERLDQRLRDIEESIIDDTLKYTGLHNADDIDEVDTKEKQEIKESIITRLMTAYNVEKMRKALAAYRRQQQQIESNRYDEGGFNEEKRVAVARKQAIDEDHHHDDKQEDNNIKCTDGDEKCNEDNFNYKVSREFIERTGFEDAGCERVEKACKEIASDEVLGPYGHIFETACNMHQMCMLCSDNSWYSPLRQCNILYISKADQLCDGNVSCQRAARDSIKYLQLVNRNIGADLNTGCNLECPDRR